jgi:hypothetical protein
MILQLLSTNFDLIFCKRCTEGMDDLISADLTIGYEDCAYPQSAFFSANLGSRDKNVISVTAKCVLKIQHRVGCE